MIAAPPQRSLRRHGNEQECHTQNYFEARVLISSRGVATLSVTYCFMRIAAILLRGAFVNAGEGTAR
ncbi:hypothetical protein [Methylobrevis pamukkalensis]|uniref:hypothetical protein n=1 Tax=Methylobrevis pamukkalensis TaxID=1439726 RepID=UPI00114C98B4|nr:hypothetical protein [Methylobrevis pamukkalensis]